MKRRPMITRLGSGGAFPITLFLALGGPRQAQAQAAQEPEETSRTVLCTPELNFEPTLSLGDLIAAPWVEDVATGQRRRLGVDPVFQATLSLGIPTELPYVELTLETIFTPFVDDNALEFEAELNLVFLRKEWTAGWVGAHFDIIDQLSPRARPGGGSTYTHKLDLELDVALYVHLGDAAELAARRIGRGLLRLSGDGAPAARGCHRRGALPRRCERVVAVIARRLASRPTRALKE